MRATLGRIGYEGASSIEHQPETYDPTDDVGAFVDVGVCPLTVLTAMLGPGRSVLSYGKVLESVVVVRLTASFYVGPGKQHGLELHGDEGSLYLASRAEFDSRLEPSAGGEYERVELVRAPYEGVDWGRALEDLVEAVEESRPPRAGGAHAAHVVEILCAIEESFRDGGRVRGSSGFAAPEPEPCAR